MLQSDRDGCGEGIHQAGDGRAFLGHLDEDFAHLAVGVEADSDVALMAGDGEFVGDRGALILQAMTNGAGRAVEILRGGSLRRGVESGRGLKCRHSGSLGDFVQNVMERCGSQNNRFGGNIELFTGLICQSLQISVGARLSGGQLSQHALANGVQRRRLSLVVHADVQRLGAFGAVAVDGHGLDALSPALGVCLGHIFDGGLLGQIDGL